MACAGPDPGGRRGGQRTTIMGILSNPWVKAFLISFATLAIVNRVAVLRDIAYPKS